MSSAPGSCALGLAAAHLDADGPDPAAPARAGRRSPGSVIPQSGVDALKTENWQAAHPDSDPIYDRLGLFGVYHSPWFAAIYLLLMISLVGCIVPRLFVYWRGTRGSPPPRPRNLTRLPDHAAYTTDEEPGVVLERAGRTSRSSDRRDQRARGRPRVADEGWVSAERG